MPLTSISSPSRAAFRALLLLLSLVAAVAAGGARQAEVVEGDADRVASGGRDLGFDLSENRIVGGTNVPSSTMYPWFVQARGCG